MRIQSTNISFQERSNLQKDLIKAEKECEELNAEIAAAEEELKVNHQTYDKLEKE